MGTIQIDGSTPKLTIGNATAEDATILFNGNAQDFYIALDDSADDLLIGLGSTVGTTPIIAIDENKLSTFSGAITVGVDDTGHDVKFFGATASAYMLWDESADDLILAGAAGLTVAGATALNGDVTLGGTTPTLTIGDAGAEDTAIIFDGNETDFYIALDDSANYLRIGTGTTIGSSYGISIDNSTLETAFYGNIKAVGASATLTMGGAVSGQDTKIVFDGNAQDYHIGLDDSSDDLVIGLGSTLGTTTHMAFDETGAITKPLQPCVQVQCGSTQSNTSSPHDIEFDTEIFDQNADFNTTNFTFTAPITGRYLVLICAQLQDIPTSPDYFQYNIVTSNRNYNATMDNGAFAATAVYFPLQFQVIAYMDASDTLVANLVYESGTTIEVLTQTYLSISLLC